MSLSCPVLNDIVLEQIAKLTLEVKNIKTSNCEITNIDSSSSKEVEQNRQEIDKIKNTLNIYKSEQLNNALLGEKLENVINNLSYDKNPQSTPKIKELETLVINLEEKINSLVLNLELNSLDKLIEKRLNVLLEIDKSKKKDSLYEKLDQILSNMTKLNIEINKINTNLSDLDRRVKIVENTENNKSPIIYRQPNYSQNNKYYQKPINKYSSNENIKSPKNDNTDGWTRVVHKKRGKRF